MTRKTAPSRRHFLGMAVRLAAVAGLATTAPAVLAAGGNGSQGNGLPQQTDPNRSIQAMRGKVFVNGRVAKPETYISPNAEVRTGPRSQVAFVAGGDVHLLKSNATVKLSSGDNQLADTVRVLAGTLMSVWGTRPAGRETQLQTATATMGIRGTMTVASKDSFTILEGKVLYKWTDSNGVQHTEAMESDGTKLVSIDRNGNRSDRIPPGLSAEDFAWLASALAAQVEYAKEGNSWGFRVNPNTRKALDAYVKWSSGNLGKTRNSAGDYYSFVEDFNTEFNNATGAGGGGGGPQSPE